MDETEQKKNMEQPEYLPELSILLCIWREEEKANSAQHTTDYLDCLLLLAQMENWRVLRRKLTEKEEQEMLRREFCVKDRLMPGVPFHLLWISF